MNNKAFRLTVLILSLPIAAMAITLLVTSIFELSLLTPFRAAPVVIYFEYVYNSIKILAGDRKQCLNGKKK